MKQVMTLALALLLSGCALSPSTIATRFESANRAIEPEVDALLGFLRDRACNAPIDILLRLAAGNSDTAEGIYYLCPTVRQFVDTINRQIPAE